MKRYCFAATIEAAGDGGACILFPYDTEKEFGTKGRVPVKATFDGIPYTGSLMKYGRPQHMLGLLKSVREQLGKQPGDTVQVELWRDEAERTVEAPPAFEAAMKDAEVFAFFNALSYTHRKEYCRWISEAKREETRTARIVKAIDLLRRGVKAPR